MDPPTTQKPVADDLYDSQEFKEFIDAENLMPLSTSDFRNPVCLEMKNLRLNAVVTGSGPGIVRSGGINSVPTAPIPTGAPFMVVREPLQSPAAISTTFSTSAAAAASSAHAEVGSMDSSDTYASCNTHPFYSQGDLTSDIADPGCALVPLGLDSNVYVNPLGGQSQTTPLEGGRPVVNNSTPRPSSAGAATGLKKSASGEGSAVRSLGASPMEESFKGFGVGATVPERGSRGSLNDAPMPKHRKTRFQQGIKPRARFGDTELRDSQESLSNKRSKKPSFIPTRSLSSASRIINQHIFGLQTLARTGKNGSKSSLSVDSIDSRTSPTLEHHRRSKSILKKSDSSGHRNGSSSADPETEKLISDHASPGGGSLRSYGEDSESSPCRGSGMSTAHSRTGSGASQLRGIGPRSSSGAGKAMPIKFIGLDNNQQARLKSPGFPLGEEKPSRKEGLYIYPPPADPPPAVHGNGDDGSPPTEETKLLLHQAAAEMVLRHRHNS